jgi:hypothetical protein
MTIMNRRLLIPLAMAVCTLICAAEPIPARMIKTLDDQLAEVVQTTSTTEARRRAKRLIRNAEKLLKKHPDASERFKVLGIIFQTQNLMYTHRQAEETGRALVATAKLLSQAPNEFAEQRLPAEMVMQQYAMASTTRCSAPLARRICLPVWWSIPTAISTTGLVRAVGTTVVGGRRNHWSRSSSRQTTAPECWRNGNPY